MTDIDNDDKIPAEHTAYDRVKRADIDLEPAVDNEFGLKVHLLHSSFRERSVMKIHDLMLKELCLSNIPDTELASIYAGKMDCIESELSMGMTDLAQSRLFRMGVRLNLLRSVGYQESLGQHGHMQTSISMEHEQIERATKQDEEEPQNKGSNPIMKLIRRR